jgi:hypothetical protein
MDHRGVNTSQGNEYANGLILKTQIAGKEGCDDERFLLTFSSVALGPSLSRSSLRIRHFKHNMQRMHMLFCRLFRNC